ncbi:lipoprotein chaperone [bacterium BMS3Abin05]|nr:lipoprotein chaperone [bacterium BMS3Abin05]GBE28282.1 lipoprotein chaperone [bacterium BMS3Bbin03]HDZ12093.1 hypothetical protein [Bacteroidota bacterium]
MLVFLLAVLLSLSSGIQTIVLDFQRVTTETGKQEESISGRLYFKQPFWMFVQVQKPLKQIMMSDRRELWIYYPVEKTAFHITTKKDNPPIFVQGILGALKEDFGLEKLGYKLTQHKVLGDTLLTIWEPPADKAKALGKFELYLADSRLVKAFSQSSDGKTKSESIYSNYKKVGNFWIPFEIETKTKDAWRVKQEIIRYKNIKLNSVIPDSLLHFAIPEKIPVKEVKW